MTTERAPLVVAIDGPAGSGKSTLARRLAEALNLPYVNTGLMYRAVTSEAVRSGIDVEDERALTSIAARLTFDLTSSVPPGELVIEGRIPGSELAAPEVEENVSAVSRHPAVREVLRAEQRRLAERGAVLEGRDIGSAVFPEAPVKIFLVATPEERAARRVRERLGGTPTVDGGSIAGSLAERDALDELVNPFVPPEGAVAIDTSGKGLDEVFEEALAIARDHLEGTP